MKNVICAWRMKSRLLIFTVLLLFANTLYAQDEPLASKRVYPVSLPIEVSNTVGGTHVDSYVVQLKKGQELQVQVENKTEHSKVSFDVVLAETEKRFGSDLSENSWSGVVPKSGDYEIRLIAYPAANYKLRVYLTPAREDETKTAFDQAVNDARTPAYSYSRRRRRNESAHKPTLSRRRP
jgi:hypothetical protein